MKNLLATLLATVAIGVMASPTRAQQPQPDGSIMWGGVRLYQKAPPPADQRAACASRVQSGLGALAMSFYGVTPWITNHPLLERNCATLLDIPPVGFNPLATEMLRGSSSLWSRVVRARIPDNVYGWRDGLGFAWCADQTCRRNILLLFSETALIGACSARPEGTRVFLLAPDDTEGWTATLSSTSCILDPKGATAKVAATSSLPGAKRFVPPPSRNRNEPAPGGSGYDTGDAIQERVGREQAAEDARRLAEERARAAAAWERMQRPNELGW